jgi:hypothetical protein
MLAVVLSGPGAQPGDIILTPAQLGDIPPVPGGAWMFQNMWTVVVIGGSIACAGLAITLGMVIMDCVLNSNKPPADGHVTVSHMGLDRELPLVEM